jgi:hypothetical protein
LEDFTQNGKYCSSGLAYPYSKDGAKCADLKEMKWNGAVLEQPYACDPRKVDVSCELHFNIDSADEAYV